MMTTNRSQEYIKKIKKVRLQLSELADKKNFSEETRSPLKEPMKAPDNEDEILYVANDVTFDEDLEGKISDVITLKDKKELKYDEFKVKLNICGTSEEVNENHESSENEASAVSGDFNCVHCSTTFFSVTVR